MNGPDPALGKRVLFVLFILLELNLTSIAGGEGRAEVRDRGRVGGGRWEEREERKEKAKEEWKEGGKGEEGRSRILRPKEP